MSEGTDDGLGTDLRPRPRPRPSTPAASGLIRPSETRVTGIGPRGSPSTARSDGPGPAGELVADGRLWIVRALRAAGTPRAGSGPLLEELIGNCGGRADVPAPRRRCGLAGRPTTRPTSCRSGWRGARVPTRFVQKYTVTVQLEPSGATEPIVAASAACRDLAAVGLEESWHRGINRGGRETVGGGRPARFCQEQMHVLAEQNN